MKMRSAECGVTGRASGQRPVELWPVELSGKMHFETTRTYRCVPAQWSPTAPRVEGAPRWSAAMSKMKLRASTRRDDHLRVILRDFAVDGQTGRWPPTA